MKLLVGRAACMPKIKSKGETFPSLNQTGESSSLDLNLGYFQKFLIICVGGRAKFGMVFRGLSTKP